jgi:hypothetical protein
VTDHDRQQILVVNPLQHTLAHYQTELLAILNQGDRFTIRVVETESGDGISGPFERVSVALRTVWARVSLAHSGRGRTVVVLWPIFGYFEPLTWIVLARRDTVQIVMHDPTPLRRSYGYSLLARTLFRAATRHPNIKIIYHTMHGQLAGIRESGVQGTVLPHPIIPKSTRSVVCDRRALNRPVVRVLGQYKETRSLKALALIADRAGGAFQLEIHGRGWPRVNGWTVDDRFVPESEFDALISSSDCVVIPYDSFFQSGVAVRCLEAGVPVVAPLHEHVRQLYGEDWAGTVRHESDWYPALTRALVVNADAIGQQHRCVAEVIAEAWRAYLAPADDLPVADHR